ncbi:MAG: hypothetical protein LBL86_09530 [Coriobacteriales bacterium]|jgi:hypothetical protein|nr:hypothetical protein [Coriobacteriales bacterium]
MSRRNASRSAIGVGLSTLVTVMVAVLLTTFSVLALAQARADLRLSEKVAASTQGYYAADGQAEHWLARLDAVVQDAPDDPAAGLVAAGYDAAVSQEGRAVVSEAFPIDERRVLVVEVAVDRAGRIDILRWQSTSSPAPE